MSIYDEIKQERERQDRQWGGPQHDDTHHPNEWIDFIHRHADLARFPKFEVPSNARSNFRRRMVQVAALAVAAIEVCDRATASITGTLEKMRADVREVSNRGPEGQKNAK